jgi:hypothetical protein
MKINDRVKQQLDELSASKSEPVIIDSSWSQSGYVVHIPADEEGNRVTLSLGDWDRYSATLRRLEVNQETALNSGQIRVIGYLEQCAQQVIRRITYLEEPLAVLEFDREGSVVQLRSYPPRHDGEALIYWEVEVSAQSRPMACLARYHWRPGQPERESLAHPVTFATLGRLAQDLALTLAEATSGHS